MYEVKVIFTAPSIEGVGGNLNHRSWSYISADTEAQLDYKIEAALNDFVMRTGVGRDIVSIEKEWDDEADGAD